MAVNLTADEWKAAADAGAAFVKEHGRHPVSLAPDAQEARLARTLLVMRKAAGRKVPPATPELVAYLEQVHPTLRVSPAEAA